LIIRGKKQSTNGVKHMLKLSECGFEPEELSHIKTVIKMFNASEVKVIDRSQLIDKLELWLAGITSQGNLQYYEMAKKYCAEITSSPSDYEYLIKYLSKRLKI
jgi:hypothetical protein